MRISLRLSEEQIRMIVKKYINDTLDLDVPLHRIAFYTNEDGSMGAKYEGDIIDECD